MRKANPPPAARLLSRILLPWLSLEVRTEEWRMNKRGCMSNSRGFTLTELMISVAVIGLLVVAAVITVGNSIRKANENVARGNLGILRMAIMTYYGTNEGVWPSNPLPNSLIPDYINEIPYLNLNGHPRTNQVVGPNITDSGGWCYNSATGSICIDCTHLGFDGTQISSW